MRRSKKTENSASSSKDCSTKACGSKNKSASKTTAKASAKDCGSKRCK